MALITVHHLGVSQSERIVWLCEELGFAYRLQRYERDPATRLAPAEYRALHPLGTAPIITDGEVGLAESGAIMEYIIARHGGGRLAVPSDDPDFPDYLFWLHLANGSVMPTVLGCWIAERLGGGGDDPLVQSRRAKRDRIYALIEQRVGEAAYLAGGRFTAADIIMFFPLTTMRAFAPFDLGPYPNIRAYVQRIGARPAYRAAMAKGDPGLTPLLS